MTAGVGHQENGDDLFSCTFKNVLMDHLVHLLPVYAGEYSPQHNPLSIQCGPQEDPVHQSHTHPVPAPFAGQESSLKIADYLMESEPQQYLIDKKEGSINDGSEWVVTAQPTNDDEQHPPLATSQ